MLACRCQKVILPSCSPVCLHPTQHTHSPVYLIWLHVPRKSFTVPSIQWPFSLVNGGVSCVLLVCFEFSVICLFLNQEIPWMGSLSLLNQESLPQVSSPYFTTRHMFILLLPCAKPLLGNENQSMSKSKVTLLSYNFIISAYLSQ